MKFIPISNLNVRKGKAEHFVIKFPTDQLTALLIFDPLVKNEENLLEESVKFICSLIHLDINKCDNACFVEGKSQICFYYFGAEEDFNYNTTI